jgi:hypothetical protein
MWKAESKNRFGWIFYDGQAQSGSGAVAAARKDSSSALEPLATGNSTAVVVAGAAGGGGGGAVSPNHHRAISFNVSVGSEGLIIVGYLRSYDKIMGHMGVYLQPLTTIHHHSAPAIRTIAPDNMTILQGRWERNVSLMQTIDIEAPQCRLTHCSVSFIPPIESAEGSSLSGAGRKFKVLSISAK